MIYIKMLGRLFKPWKWKKKKKSEKFEATSKSEFDNDIIENQDTHRRDYLKSLRRPPVVSFDIIVN